MFDQLKRQVVREGMSVKSVVSLLIFGAICLVFVFFGLPSKNQGTGAGSAARVNNALISVADLRNETQRLEQVYAPLMGGNFGGDAQRQFLRTQAVDNLISMELITQAAQHEGILATDAEVREFILKDIPVFQKDGQFQRELYQNYLSYTKTGAGEFEEKIRKDRKTQRTRRLFEVAAAPLALEIQKVKTLKEAKMNVAFAKIDKDQWLERTPVAEKEIQAQLAQAEFKKRVEAYFKANPTEFMKDVQVHAQHILIKAPEGDQEAEKKALAKANDLKKRAAKEDFAKLAKEFSDDTGSKDKGGDLGTFGKGRMVPEFEKAAFEQPVGSVGDPVKTPYGYHIVKVLEKTNAEVPELSQAEPRIAKKLILADKFDAEMKSLEEAVQAKDASRVDQAIKNWGQAWSETGFFDLSQDTIPQLGSPIVSSAAFELSEANPVLGRVVRDGGIRYVMKLKGLKKDVAADQEKSLMGEMSKENSYQLFSQWIETAKKTANIQKNNEVIQGR